MIKEINKIEQILHEAPDNFNSKLPAIERKILNEILLQLKELDIKNGRVVSNIANLKRVNTIKRKLKKVVVNKEYLKDLKTFAGSFVQSANAIQAYYKSMMQDWKPDPYYLAIRNSAVDNAMKSLTGAGLDANVLEPIRRMMLTAVTSGQSYTSLAEALRTEIIGNEDRVSSLSRYVGTYTVTALSLFNGQYLTAINKDLGWKWWRYSGSNIETTREFCEHATKKKWFHESEFETVLSGEIDGVQVDLNPRNGLPRGMFDGTDVANFTVNVGGWRCRHRLIPAPDAAVPDDVKKKLEEKNNFAASKNQEMLIKNQRAKFDAYDENEWVKYYFDENSGGFVVYHNDHKFDKKKGAFGLERGDYERISSKILARYGKIVELGSEAPDGKKIADGFINGKKFDIKGIEGDGKDNIYYDIRDTSKKGANTIVLYYHDSNLFDLSKIHESYNRYIGNSKSKRLRNVYYIVDDKLHKME